MSTLYSKIDLSKLPPPEVVEALDYENILQAAKDDLIAIDPTYANHLWLESDPLHKLLQVFAYRELYLRQRINEAAKNLMLATARGTNLEHLSALFGIERREITPGDPKASPPIPATIETDEKLRERTQMVFEGFSSAGSKGGYSFYAQLASTEDENGNLETVRDVEVDSPNPGIVRVTVLSDQGNGEPSDALIQAVENQLNDKRVRPITDQVLVEKAEIISYSIKADLYINSGVGYEEVQKSTEKHLQKYVIEFHGLGYDITLSGIYAALHIPGVQKVDSLVLTVDGNSQETLSDIEAINTQAAYCPPLPDDENYGIDLTFHLTEEPIG